MANGYGHSPYGQASFGDVETDYPSMIPLSINGYQIQVTFNEPMQQASVLDLASWSIAEVTGVAVSITDIEEEETQDGGATVIVITHTGTTLGGTYTLIPNGPVDLVGNPLVDSVSLLCRGEDFTFTAEAISPTEVVLEFSTDLSDPGSVSDYEIVDRIDYPISLVVESITHPYDGDDNKVLVTVSDQTSLTYDVTVSPASAITYDGSTLPLETDELLAIPINAGAGSSVIDSGALVMESLGVSEYGYAFWDTSGKITTTSAVRADLQFEVHPGALIAGTIEPLQFVFADAATGAGHGLSVILRYAAGTYQLRLVSGAFTTTVNADWSDGGTLSLVRNPDVEIWTVLVNDHPWISAPFADLLGVSATVGGPGVAVVLAAIATNSFIISGLSVSSSSTVYSAALNFLHGVTDAFVGDDGYANNVLLTTHGPLVKDWGDATPATPNDVTVRLNGTEVAVRAVNPWNGSILLETPIPYQAPGTVDVEIDYRWMHSPIMEFASLNTLGLVLNQYFIGSSGRFPMATVLGPLTRPNPKYIAHRYMGFERAYTSALNSPTTLLFNRPMRNAVDPFRRTLSAAPVSWEGLQVPTEEGWALSGTDTGGPNTDGTYNLLDESSSPYEEDSNSCAVYSQSIDSTYAFTGYFVSRFTIDAYTLDGVFTGVGFGCHTNRKLFFVGCLEINGVRHVGVLSNPERPDLTASWNIGPNSQITIKTASSFEIPNASIPLDFQENDRFQILDGVQAGTYTISSLSRGAVNTTIVIEEVFPASYKAFGGQYPTVYFETDWRTLFTYRLEVDTAESSCTLTVSGDTRGSLSLSASSVRIPPPSELPLVLPLTGTGATFFGSFSRTATNQTTWSFYRAGVVPYLGTELKEGVLVQTEMTALPEDNEEPWFREGVSNSGAVASSVLTLKDLGAHSGVYATYSRYEPFLTSKAILDLQADLSVTSGSRGVGDASLLIDDGKRKILLATLLYAEGYSAPYRRLLKPAQLSFIGFSTPEEQGWDIDTQVVLTEVRNQAFFQTGWSLNPETNNGYGYYSSELDLTEMAGFDSGSRIFEAAITVVNLVGSPPISFGGNFGSASEREVIVRLAVVAEVPYVYLVSDGAAVVAYTFDWNDGVEHIYRVTAIAEGSVTLTIDGEVQLLTQDYTDFVVAGNNTSFAWGVFPDLPGDAEDTATILWRAVTAVAIPSASAKRTLGVLRGTDEWDIDSWELPRSDSSSALNSAQVGPAIEEMDWTATTEVRVLRDPEWGVTVIRPDLAAPPYYVAESGSAGSGFLTETVEPSAGWINVEYKQLPRATSLVGKISFGSLNAEAITEQLWDYVRYRIFNHPSDSRSLSHPMVLNRFNVIHSGELGKDTTPESVILEVTGGNSVNLRPTQVYAKSVFKVVDGSTIWTQESWDFDARSQILTLKFEEEFANPLVTVVYSASVPTETYLRAEPFWDSATLLNEGTPPFVLSQVGKAVKGEDSTGGALARDFLTYTDPEGTYLEEAEHFTIDNDGDNNLLAIACDGVPLQESAGLVIEFSGDLFTESGIMDGWDLSNGDVEVILTDEFDVVQATHNLVG
jgi:hypothetical protein